MKNEILTTSSFFVRTSNFEPHPPVTTTPLAPTALPGWRSARGGGARTAWPQANRKMKFGVRTKNEERDTDNFFVLRSKLELRTSSASDYDAPRPDSTAGMVR